MQKVCRFFAVCCASFRTGFRSAESPPEAAWELRPPVKRCAATGVQHTRPTLYFNTPDVLNVCVTSYRLAPPLPADCERADNGRIQYTCY